METFFLSINQYIGVNNTN